MLLSSASVRSPSVRVTVREVELVFTVNPNRSLLYHTKFVSSAVTVTTTGSAFSRYPSGALVSTRLYVPTPSSNTVLPFRASMPLSPEAMPWYSGVSSCCPLTTRYKSNSAPGSACVSSAMSTFLNDTFFIFPFGTRRT